MEFLKRFALKNVRTYATAGPSDMNCKLLVLGGGAGGCSIASKFVNKLGNGKVVVVEPNDVHYYQPMLTMIGGGIKKLSEASRPMSTVLPPGAVWVRDSVSSLHPQDNKICTGNGSTINYEYLVVATGLELLFDKIPGLVQALESSDSPVASNYSPKYVDKTYKFIGALDKGNAVFTFPATPVKCAGAPLKACFISEDFIRKNRKRDNVNFFYMTSLPAIFSVPHYAVKLKELCEKRGIDVNYQNELVEIKPETKEAIFRKVTDPQSTQTIQYSFLHVTPPMGPSQVLKTSPSLVDASGFLKVNKETLQSETYPNIYGIGDCTNLPTSKTAAAVAAQCGVLFSNLSNDMDSKKEKKLYDGYTSCPLVTGYGSCILAEFDYNLKPLETFPFDQSVEHKSMYLMKKDMMPALYWNLMLKGYWNGPKAVRKFLHFGLGK